MWDKHQTGHITEGYSPGQRQTDMKRKLFFPLLAALLLAPWPVAYAHDVSAGQSPVHIEAAEAAAAPNVPQTAEGWKPIA